MEKITAFYEQLSERFRSPFIFSFFFSWIVVNWRVFVYLFWYNETTILELGYPDLIAIIEKSLNHWNCWQLPLISAFAYSLVYPQLKNLISWYYAWANKIGDKRRHIISVSTVVPFARYDAKVKKLIELEKELVESMERESETIQQYSEEKVELVRENKELTSQTEDLRNSKIEVEKTLDKVQKDLYEIRAATNSSRFNGIWKVDINNTLLEWTIEDSKVTVLDENNVSLGNCHIEFSYWKQGRNSPVILLIQLHGRDEPYKKLFVGHRIYAILSSNTEGTVLNGNSAEGRNIILKKIHLES